MALIDMAWRETDLAYAAGVIDADGSISVSRNAYVSKRGIHGYRITVRVDQKLEEIPLWFAATFGGKVRQRNKSKQTINQRGQTVTFPPMFFWDLYCQDAANFLEATLPYLKMKRYRAELAIKLARMHRFRGGKGFRYGGLEITPQEGQERERVALLLRAENQKGNTRVAMRGAWGVIQ